MRYGKVIRIATYLYQLCQRIYGQALLRVRRELTVYEGIVLACLERGDLAVLLSLRPVKYFLIILGDDHRLVRHVEH